MMYSKMPPFLFSADKLPKGYKLTEGIKVQQKAGSFAAGWTIYFRVIGDDIWINSRHFFREAGTPYKKKHSIIYIKNYRDYPANYVCSFFTGIPLFASALMKFYKDNGCWLGYTYPVLRKPGEKQSKQLLTTSKKCDTI